MKDCTCKILHKEFWSYNPYNQSSKYGIKVFLQHMPTLQVPKSKQTFQNCWKFKYLSILKILNFNEFVINKTCPSWKTEICTFLIAKISILLRKCTVDIWVTVLLFSLTSVTVSVQSSLYYILLLSRKDLLRFRSIMCLLLFLQKWNTQ